jgi:hypothetical protein
LTFYDLSQVHGHLKTPNQEFSMNQLEMKYLWHSTNEKLPSPHEEVLGFASSPDLENLGYHVVTYNPKMADDRSRTLPIGCHWNHR